MTLNAPLLLLLAACTAGAARRPRNLLQFGQLIQCFQPGVNPLKYNEYGCWCGLGGQGTPLDQLDSCCKVHDNCYEASRKAAGCTSLADLPYVIVYDFACSGQQASCSASNNKCQAAVCECDRAAAECFARTPYNPDYKYVDPKVQCS
ncbi:uncharacterized protein V6R79_001555 [Siganus canaliculatus]